MPCYPPLLRSPPVGRHLVEENGFLSKGTLLSVCVLLHVEGHFSLDKRLVREKFRQSLADLVLDGCWCKAEHLANKFCLVHSTSLLSRMPIPNNSWPLVIL